MQRAGAASANCVDERHAPDAGALSVALMSTVEFRGNNNSENAMDWKRETGERGTKTAGVENSGKGVYAYGQTKCYFIRCYGNVI